jgi:hypothetical protein
MITIHQIQFTPKPPAKPPTPVAAIMKVPPFAIDLSLYNLCPGVKKRIVDCPSYSIEFLNPGKKTFLLLPNVIYW